ncbi:MAG: LruC domain-containing protein, partial [Bacteroidales bacterium]|nr:LruC domain-containing protein [Bacteroidales bacterium]
PWGLNIIQGFQYPVELDPINEAYLYFIEWAESNGTAKTDWFSNTGAGYRNQLKVY